MAQPHSYLRTCFPSCVMMICEVGSAHSLLQNGLVLPLFLLVEGTLLLFRLEALPNFVFPYIHPQAPQDYLSWTKHVTQAFLSSDDKNSIAAERVCSAVL